MCKCTPEIRTPFCGKPGCQWPAQVRYYGFTAENEPLIKFSDDVEALIWQERFKHQGYFLLKKINLKVELV